MIKFDYIETQRKGKITCDEGTLSIIRSHFSVANDAAKYAKQWGKQVASRLYAITPTGLFDFGLYVEIRKYLITLNLLDIEYTDTFTRRLNSGVPNLGIFDGLEYPLRDYQLETIEKGFRLGQGTIVIGTGGGKSLITAAMLESYYRHYAGEDKTCLIVVPGISLVSQLENDFAEYGVSFEYSTWTAKGKAGVRSSSGVVITNTENLLAKFDKNPSILDVDLLIVDEAHTITSKNKISKVISKFKTPNRFGFTGTLPKNKMDRWKVLGTFGPIIYEKNSKELRDDGHLVDVSVKMIKLNHGKTGKMDYNQELEYVYNSEKRNELITKLASRLENNTLCLVNHLEQGHNLQDKFSEIPNKTSYFIRGETNLDERDDIKKLMADKNDVIVNAMSKIFATGINIPNIHNLLFVAGGKAFIRTVQGIGRGLRLHHTKTKLTIIDIYDSLKYSERHAELRKEIYDDEQIAWNEVEIDLI
jgi:superfamily II DNA or RNA helicase